MSADATNLRNGPATVSGAIASSAAAASSTASVRLPQNQQQQQQQTATTTTSTATPMTNTTTNTNTIPQQQQQQQQQQQGHPTTTAHHHHHNSHHHSGGGKADEIEILESAASAADEVRLADKFSNGWICCAPCIWLRTSAAVHKIAITTATLLVTTLLVASPVLFLLSTAPSQLPRECNSKNELDCAPLKPQAPECDLPECQSVALNLLARMNWQLDVCNAFRDFTCSSAEGSLKAVSSAQEDVDMQMLQLLTHNTSVGPYQKLGRLYGSCLRQMVNATSIRHVLDGMLGGYLPVGSVGPSSISSLMAKIHRIGPTPLISIYYDLSYGKQPQTMLVVDGANPNAPVLQMAERWHRPKAAPHSQDAASRDDDAAHLDTVLAGFLSDGLTTGQRVAETATIVTFMRRLRRLREETLRGDFADSYVMYNVSTLSSMFTFLNWSDLVVHNWSGPILLRSADYLTGLQTLLDRTQRRVVHNSMLVMFALAILPPGKPDALVCTRATMWAMPEVASALYASQFSAASVRDVSQRTEVIFEVLKAWLKRAPSLKGAALVKLSQLRVQLALWPQLHNQTAIGAMLDAVPISSDNWFDNVLAIFRTRRAAEDGNSFASSAVDLWDNNNSSAWSYPTVARAFYDPLSHSILVPLSVIQTAYFNAKLQPYMHYASVGAAIATEILRSITKSFEAKLLQCVPSVVNVVTNSSRMDLLCQSGGMQIAYHSMLSLSGPLKGMTRLPGINMSPTQLFFLVYSQTVCAAYDYAGVPVFSDDFAELLSWLVAQGGSATQVFQCPYYSVINQQKSCNVL